MNRFTLHLPGKIIALCALIGAPQTHAMDMDNVFINGFISQGYLKSSDNHFKNVDTADGSFEFNEFGVSIKTILTDELTAGIQLFSRDFGETGNNDVQIDWAFLDYRWRDYLGIRAGKFKKPEGLYNTTRDADFTRTSILLPQGIYDEQIRDINIAVQGVGIYGIIETNSLGYLDYSAYFGNQPVNEEEPLVASQLSGLFGFESDANWEFKSSVGIQLFWNTPIEGLRLGQSWNAAHAELTGTNENPSFYWYPSLQIPTNFQPIYSDIGEFEYDERRISSIEYLNGNFTFAAEYMYFDFNFNNTAIGGPIIVDSFGIARPTNGEYGLTWESWYLMGSYRFNNWFVLGAYYSDFEETIQNTGNSDGFEDFTVSLRFDINEFWIIKGEVHFIDGSYTAADADPNDNAPADDNYRLFAIKTSLSF